MKILVTGGTVFVSRFTAEYFRDKGHDVYVLNRNTRTQSRGVTLITADRHDLSDTLKEYCFDVIIDANAYTSDDINGLLDSVGGFGDYIFISSGAVYPEAMTPPFYEDNPTGENSFWGKYGTDKLKAEKALLSRVPSAYIIRPPYLYGEMNNLYREAFVFECAEQELPFYVPGDGEKRLQFFHVKDLCRFIEILLEEKPEQHIFNVGNPNTITINEWVELCYDVMGIAPYIINVEPNDVRSFFPFHYYDYVLNVNRMSELMKELTPLKDGLRRSYEWYKNNRDLVRKKDFLGYIDKNLK